MPTLPCHQPFSTLEVGFSGNVYLCCPNWTKVRLGSLYHSSLMALWNNEIAQEVRRSMYEARVGHVCRKDACPALVGDRRVDTSRRDRWGDWFWDDEIEAQVRDRKTVLETPPRQISLAQDGRCNLRCIMCGSNHDGNPHHDAALNAKLYRELYSLLPELYSLKLTGDGDPFYQQETRQLLQSFDPEINPRLEFYLITHGLLLTPKMWETIRHNKIRDICVSVDGATQQTYEKIRVNGRWELLQQNLRHLSEQLHQGAFKRLSINMTVMRSNFREIPDFARMGLDLGVSYVYFQRIFGEYGDENIFDRPDAETTRALEAVLSDPVLEHPDVYVDGIRSPRAQAA